MWLDSKAVNCPQKWGNFSFPARARPGPVTKETTIYRVMGTAAASGSPLLARGGH